MSTTTFPVVSFLIPCTGNTPYLWECISSILNQSFRDFELLILDDASTDDLPRLAEHLARTDDKVRHHRQETEVGTVKNCNAGLEHAQGSLIWFLSPDDCLATPNIVQDFVTEFILHPKLGYAFCRAQFIDENSTPYENYLPAKKNSDMPYQPTLYPGREFFRQLLKTNLIPISSAIARKTCFERHGGFHPQLIYTGAWHHWLRSSLDWDVYFDPSPKIYHRKVRQLHADSSEQSPEFLENTVLCYRELENYLQENGYPKPLQRHTQLARLQFMRKNHLPMSAPEKIVRLYHKLTMETFNFSQV